MLLIPIKCFFSLSLLCLKTCFNDGFIGEALISFLLLMHLILKDSHGLLWHVHDVSISVHIKDDQIKLTNIPVTSSNIIFVMKTLEIDS